MKKLLYLPVLLIFLLLSCEEQEILQLEEETQTTNPDIYLESFTIGDLPDLANTIYNSTKKSRINWTSKSDGQGIVLDESRILAVTDSVGNITYSVRMLVPETPYNVFYNMVSKRTAEGEQNEPMVLRYKVNEDYAPVYFTSDRKDAPFKGDLSVYKLSTFGDIGFSSKGGLEEEPCYNYSSGDGSGGSGSGGSGCGDCSVSDSSDNWGYWDPDGGYTSYWISWGGGVGEGTQEFSADVEVGQGNFGDFGTDGTFKRNISGKNDDCPDDELLLPINEEDEDVLLIPSCQSFEYANGNLVKAAGVSNIQNVFIAAGVDSNGPYTHNFHLNIPKSYFSMPKYWTNGGAANATAKALHSANLATKTWFLGNPKASGYELGVQWEKNIKTAMRAIGGDFTRNEPFPIRNLAPYAEDWAWNKTDCTR